MARNEVVQVGVIGAGGMGGTHARNLHNLSGARVAAVMDADGGRAAQVAAECGGATPFTDALALIQDPAVQAVLIASPDPSHADLTLACLAAGKPVLCEKPLAISLEEGERIVQAEMAAGRKGVWLGFVRRFDPLHRDVQRMAAQDAIGTPYLYKGWHRNAQVGPGARNEDFLNNSASHDFDAARWLLGGNVREISVRGVNTDPALGSHVCDLMTIQAVLDNGKLAQIELYVNCAYGYETGVELVGGHGVLTIGPNYSPTLRASQHSGVAVEQDWLGRLAAGYRLEVEAWIDDIQNGAHSGATAWDGWRALQASQSAILALETGRIIDINLGETPALYQ